MLFPFDSSSGEFQPTRAHDAASPAAVCHAQVRQGLAEHEWLQPERSPALRYECRTARMIVAPDRCLAASDGETIEIELTVAPGAEPAVLDVLLRLPEGSWILVTGPDGSDLTPSIVEDSDQRARIMLPDGAVRVSARLGDGARLSARVARPGH